MGEDDIFVAKFDAAGIHLWSQRFGFGGNQRGFSVATDASGNVIVTGYFEGSADFGGGSLVSAGGYDLFVAKFNAAGTHLWSQRFGDASDTQYFPDVATDGSGNVIVTGYFQGTVDFGGGALVSAGASDIFVARFDAAGTHVWSQRFGDADTQRAFSVAADGSGDFILAGDFFGTVDFGGGGLTSAGANDVFVARFDAAGTHLWSRGFGDINSQYMGGVTVDGWGNAIVTGDFYGTVDFGGGALTSLGLDVFVARFDAAGNHLWSQRFGTFFSQYGVDVAADDWGNVVATGYFQGTMDFGGGPLTSAGGIDIFVAKFWRSPEIHAVRDVPGDQGGWVNLAWDGSGADSPAEHAIKRYTIWRAIDPSLASVMLASGATLGTEPPDGLEGAESFIRAERAGAATYYWYLITSMDAYYLPGYSAPIPTLFDSTVVSSEYHYFQVIAHTPNPYVFFTSDPDSGYSIDNLAPGQPQSLVAQQSATPYGVTLSWKPNTEADLSHYAVYRGASPGFVPGPGNLIASPQDTTTFDGGWQWSAGYHYKVSALDVHGNESSHALVGPEDVSGDGGGAVPVAVYLLQNAPNPFNPTTRIVFGIRQASHVILAVFDAAGRRVAVLVDGRREAGQHVETWDGLDDRARPAASGVYFYRLTTPGETLTRKMVLLK
jgi:hypothetical protein